MYRRQRLPCGPSLLLLVARRAAGLWRREQSPKRTGKCVGGRRLVIAVGMRLASIRVQGTDHGCRMFSLILHLFSLDFVRVEVSYRRKADAAGLLAQRRAQEQRTRRGEKTNTDLCLLASLSVSIAEEARERALTVCAVYWTRGGTAAVKRRRVPQTYVPTRSVDPRC
jgi:hypothetical protein